MAPSRRIAVTFSHNILVFKAFYSTSNAQPYSVIQNLNDILLKPGFFFLFVFFCPAWLMFPIVFKTGFEVRREVATGRGNSIMPNQTPRFQTRACVPEEIKFSNLGRKEAVKVQKETNRWKNNAIAGKGKK